MTHHNIAEVRGRLEAALAALPSEPADAAELFGRTERLAAQILSNEFEDYTSGSLQELLMSYLYIRQIELGLLPFPDPKEV